MTVLVLRNFNGRITVSTRVILDPASLVAIKSLIPV